MEKYSKQGTIILNELKSRIDHPTAAMVLEGLNQKGYRIGIATVYRNLQKLSDNNRILKIKTENGTDRFDGNVEPHIHFECKKCGDISDIFLSNKEKKELLKSLSKYTVKINALIEETNIKMTGLCEKCNKK